MAQVLKSGMSSDAMAENDAQVRATVEGILSQIETRGDAAVRELSAKFDRWEPESFKLTEQQVEALVGSLANRDLVDIRFAQAQVRN